jgi:Na+/H+ antiporter NhaD/arsenite permease-like protein
VVIRLVFLATYLVLAFGRLPFFRVDRTAAAVIGAIAMIVAGGLTLDQAYLAIDYRTLILLFGMMVLVATLRLGTFFRTLGQAVVGRVTHPAALLVVVVVVSGALSALFVNDTVCLVFTPILIEIAAARRQDPLPFLLALATASNIGSTATITGNPQNMLIGSMSHIRYTSFSAALAPVALFGLAVDAAVICLVFRSRLRHAEGVAERQPSRPIHRILTMKGLIVAAGMLVGFLAGAEPALVAATGAAVLLITRWIKPEKIYDQIDWGLLMLFVGLFVVIAGAEHAGLDRLFFGWLRPVGITTAGGLTVTVAILSNLISNVPAVMLFTRLVPHVPDPQTAWLVLAMGSTLAGNLTLLGSIANLIVAEGARREGIRIRFVDYLKVGVPVTVVTLAFGVWWLS